MHAVVVTPGLFYVIRVEELEEVMRGELDPRGVRIVYLSLLPQVHPWPPRRNRATSNAEIIPRFMRQLSFCYATQRVNRAGGVTM